MFLEDGGLPIHNNDTERDLRRLTIGRKNWLFLGSEAGGEVAARLYTITASAHRHDVDLWAYLDDVLRQLASDQADLEIAPAGRLGQSDIPITSVPTVNKNPSPEPPKPKPAAPAEED